MKLTELPSSFRRFLIPTGIHFIGYFALWVMQPILFLLPPYQFTPGEIAILLGIFAITDRGCGLVWAPYIRTFHYKPAIIMGSIITAVAYFGIFLVPHFYFVALMLLLAGLGLSLRNLAGKLWVASFSDEKRRTHSFSWLYRTVNAASAIGHVAFFYLPYNERARECFLGISGLFLLATIVYIFLFHPLERYLEEKVTFPKLVRSIWKDFPVYRSSFLWLGCLFVFTFFALQIDMVPYFLKQYRTLPSSIGWIIALNPIMVVFLQGYFTRLFYWIHERKPGLGIAAGFVLVTISYFIFATTQGIYGLWIFVFVLTTGEMFIGPQVDSILSGRSPARILPFIFAIQGILFSFAKMTGDSGSVFFMDLFYQSGLDPNLWWCLNGISLAGIAFIGLLLFLKKKPTTSFKAHRI